MVADDKPGTNSSRPYTAEVARAPSLPKKPKYHSQMTLKRRKKLAFMSANCTKQKRMRTQLPGEGTKN